MVKKKDEVFPIFEVSSWKLVKKNEDGNVFEILEGGDSKPTICTLRIEGRAPKESYSEFPFKQPKGE